MQIKRRADDTDIPTITPTERGRAVGSALAAPVMLFGEDDSVGEGFESRTRVDLRDAAAVDVASKETDLLASAMLTLCFPCVEEQEEPSLAVPQGGHA